MIVIVRVPYLSEYNLLDVREEPIVSSLSGYLMDAGHEHQVFDFHLNRQMSIDTLVAAGSDAYVICVRGTGLHWKYAQLIGRHLYHRTNAKIVFYGQTGKLQSWANPDAARFRIVPHDEASVCHELGLAATDRSFTGGGLRHQPYALGGPITPRFRESLFKAALETTRGCHYGCGFCFINHGTNYPRRFSRRPTADVLADMHQYLAAGVRDFWFYDSEFIGGDRNDYPAVTALLDAMASECSDASTMLYARADTLARYGDYGRLRKAGVSSILLGIESLDDAALKTLRKGQSAGTAMDTIRRLMDEGIFCHLSFILFNRGATAASIRRNIEAMRSLYDRPGWIYAGQSIYFSYAFESDWGLGERKGRLSGVTRLSGSTTSTSPPIDGVSFDPALEPYAELCRIINYEQIRKLTELTLASSHELGPGSQSLHRWAALLNPFVLDLMDRGLTAFEDGRLSLRSVPEYEQDVFAAFRSFNDALLPVGWRHTITDRDGYWAGDWNGWERQIPSMPDNTLRTL